MQSKRKGAYLTVEIALGICALLILAVGMFNMNLTGMLSDSKEKKAQSDVYAIGSAVQHYRYDTGEYPSDLSVLADKGTGSLEGYGPWIDKIGKDPWGNDYQISFDSDEFVVYSKGKSGSDSNDDPTKVASGVIGFHGH